MSTPTPADTAPAPEQAQPAPTPAELEKAAEMEKAAAEQLVFQEVFVPAFVKAAAAHGIAINTQGDLQNALQICGQIDMARQHLATQSDPGLAKAAAALDQTLRGAPSPAPLSAAITPELLAAGAALARR